MKESLEEVLRATRAERYACQALARDILPTERVKNCLRKRSGSTLSREIEVYKHRTTKKAFYAGLMVCGSVWICPVCAGKISERRRKELQVAFDTHKQNGGHIAFLTLTFSHKKKDKLKVILDTFSNATKKFMTGSKFQKIREKMGIIGRIRVTEVTYGVNGFHPHVHIAIFYENETNLKEMEDRLYVLWENACEKVELTTNRKHGLTLQDGDAAQDYLSKHGNWSLEQEMSKAHIKKAKNGSMTPFDFLRRYLEEEDEKYLKLFVEYAKCFKGKRQLQWSQGLKKRFILEDKSDEQLAEEQSEEADLLGEIPWEIWKHILRTESRSFFLDMCEKNGFEGAISLAMQYKYKKEPSIADNELDLYPDELEK